MSKTSLKRRKKERLLEAANNSSYPSTEDVLYIKKVRVAPLEPKSNNQALAMNAMGKPLVVLSGSAGVGKTEVAIHHACSLFAQKEIDTIIITRPAKTMGKDGGAVPGGDELKLLAYVMPMLMKMKRFLGVQTLKNHLCLETINTLFKEANGIQIVALEKIGGMSFDNRTIIIADEMQNAEVAQIKSLVTRCEEGCQLILCGDTTQSAIRNVENGLEYIEGVLEDYPHEDAALIHFTPDDCLRSGISKHLTQIFEKEGQW